METATEYSNNYAGYQWDIVKKLMLLHLINLALPLTVLLLQEIYEVSSVSVLHMFYSHQFRDRPLRINWNIPNV